MVEVTVHEVVSVTVQVDSEYPDQTRVRPRTVWFDTDQEALDAIKRALARLPAVKTTVMVSRERPDRFEHDNDPDLDDWPADRHIVNGPMTAEDFR